MKILDTRLRKNPQKLVKISQPESWGFKLRRKQHLFPFFLFLIILKY